MTREERTKVTDLLSKSGLRRDIQKLITLTLSQERGARILKNRFSREQRFLTDSSKDRLAGREDLQKE